jgi:CRP/FNR family cyclic AMP-dependent transcriptional regulator
MRRALYMLGQLSDDNIEWMIAKGKREQVATGTVLIEEGKESGEVLIVLDGQLGIYVQSASGDQRIAVRGAGEILGEMSFVDGRPPTATVKAEEPSALYTIPKAVLAAQLEEDRDFAARFYRGIAISLSYRLSELMHPEEADAEKFESIDDLDEDDMLDADVLDSAYLAGLRFERILKRMMQ